MINKGDIVLVHQGDISKAQAFIAYDRGIVIGCNILGTYAKNLKFLFNESGTSIVALTPNSELSNRRKSRLSDFLQKLLCGEKKLTFKERLNFIKYIAWIYMDTVGYSLVDHPSILITPVNLFESKSLVRYNIK